MKKAKTEFGIIGIWEITESLQELELKYDLSEKERSELNLISAEKRKKEFLIVKILLKEILKFTPEIIYEKTGKPKLANSKLNISISHSADLAVVFVSEKSIGIDVENCERDISKITSRFLHRSEIEFTEKSANVQDLKIILWCAKEAIFKCCREQGIRFNSEIIIQPFRVEENTFFLGKRIGSMQTDYFKLWFFYVKNNVVVGCVEN
ncbi:MAG: 4'-phosphopantetheinyl transferase superfamily protein [Bacteroidales bacterium]|nr:4'-phosphopantetheinyl transferase superfamily protein [Bacteroidales bacterium]